MAMETETDAEVEATMGMMETVKMVTEVAEMAQTGR
jgi:hypothetical protein